MTVKRIALLVAGALSVTACSSLPPAEKVEKQVWLDQNWNPQQRQWFHNTTQGTATIPVPYEWFAALERPGITIFGEPEMLLDNEYLSRLGFIPGEINTYNPVGMPVGFSVDFDAKDPFTGERFNAIGLTCAACHTGQMRYNDVAIRYDGGPAMTDLTKLTGILFMSMLETRYSTLRFNRFAERVLGEQNTESNRKALKKEFSKKLMTLIAGQLAVIRASDEKIILQDIEAGRESKILKDIAENVKSNFKSVEGFTRLDALNRIGNTVFAMDTHKLENYVTPDAPVNYPHIWTTSWFDWVQYDGSVMQPMVRNAGEALGVAALVNLDGSSPNQFQSTVAVKNLFNMEEQLAGKHPLESKQFTGLKAPQWPEALLPAIDRSKAAQGAALYKENCQKCHMPPINSDEFWNTETVWSAKGTSGQPLMRMRLVPLNTVGTDPAQAEVLMTRKVSTEGMKLNTSVYTPNSSGVCASKPVESQPDNLFAFALGAVVQQTVDHWYNENNVDPVKRNVMNGERLNCLQAGAGYKARPLNGIWATGPFLHNGSVPTLYHLLSPVEERPAAFYLGSLDFDPKLVGYNFAEGPGLFKLDTRLKGNSNSGHEFTNERSGKGVVGRGLNEEERWALVEYLKTL